MTRTRTTTRTTTGIAATIVGGLAAVLLTACAVTPLPSAADDPFVEDDRPMPLDGAPPSADCLDLYPEAGTSPDLAHYSAVPTTWAQPSGVELCVAVQVDETATLHYVTGLDPDAVIDEWEPLLGDYDVIRDIGLAELPVLYATNRTTAATIQALDGGAVLIGIQKLG